jgi:hypothetical protein
MARYGTDGSMELSDAPQEVELTITSGAKVEKKKIASDKADEYISNLKDKDPSVEVLKKQRL